MHLIPLGCNLSGSEAVIYCSKILSVIAGDVCESMLDHRKAVLQSESL